jgi:hypothetical protein
MKITIELNTKYDIGDFVTIYENRFTGEVFKTIDYRGDSPREIFQVWKITGIVPEGTEGDYAYNVTFDYNYASTPYVSMTVHDEMICEKVGDPHYEIY